MPVYSVETAKGALSRKQKQELAEAIPRVHQKVTGARPDLVNVFYDEVDAADRYLAGRPGAMTPVIHCHLRAGASDLEYRSLLSAVNEEWNRVTGHRRTGLIIEVDARPARISMEGGRFLPEHGLEEAWMHGIQKADT
jgi:phenylpyruvate tautomerase PptA (4-oxalocrotonate tautomerase family)